MSLKKIIITLTALVAVACSGAEETSEQVELPEIGQAKQALGLLELAPEVGDLFFSYQILEDGPWDTNVYQGASGPMGGGSGWSEPDPSWMDYGSFYTGRVDFEATLPSFRLTSGPYDENGQCPNRWVKTTFTSAYGDWTTRQPLYGIATGSPLNPMLCLYTVPMELVRVEKNMNGLYDCYCDGWSGLAFFDADTPQECPWDCPNGPWGIFQ